MKFKLQPYSIHELGQRQNQEDSMFPDYGKSTKEDRLFILCDGMGGHEKGEVASATVCEAMSKCILSRWNPNEPLSDDLLQQAIEEAYDALDAKDSGGEKKMGTTMTFVCFHKDGVTVAHIGDSRVYQLRPATKNEPAHIVFKTRDHSLVNDLIKIGEITEEEAKTHPQKNVITRAMQPHQERRAKADISHLTDIQEGDYFYMCSDGMLEQTSDENLLFIITKPKAKNEEKVEMLRNVTSENKDNHTAHLIYINKVEKEVVNSGTNGTYITPDDEPRRRSEFPIFIILGLILVAIIAGAAYYFFCHTPLSDKESSKETDSIENYVPEKHSIADPQTTSKQKVADDNKNADEEEGVNNDTTKSNIYDSSKQIPNKKEADPQMKGHVKNRAENFIPKQNPPKKKKEGKKNNEDMNYVNI